MPARTPVVPVSWGELLDKIAILEIKAARIDVTAKRTNVERELAALRAVVAPERVHFGPEIDRLENRLRAVNETLWDIEDEIRALEAMGDFGPAFVDLARAVYNTNDRRAALKRAINEAVGSEHVEEKHFTTKGFDVTAESLA
jgi:hypothetical protein